MGEKVPYPQAFFQLQSEFALKIAKIKGIFPDDALLKYTTFYIRIGGEDWEFDPTNELWQKYILQVHNQVNPAAAAYSMYFRKFYSGFPPKAPDSCFSYEYDNNNKSVSIHFQNNFSDISSPLSAVNIPARKNELRFIFQNIKANYPETRSVIGETWLFAYEAYRRLFPPEYIAGLKVQNRGYKGNGRWGQFIMNSGGLNQARADQFIESIKRAESEKELTDSFPYDYLETQAAINVFYRYFSV